MTLSSFLASTLVFLLCVGNVHHVHGLPAEVHPRQLESDTVLAEAFLCDADFNKISSDNVVNKGDPIRICVKTHVRAKVQGISIAKVIDFFLVREFEDAGDMEQILLQGGVVANANDELTCQPGSELCVLESAPMDAFFGRDGTVSAIGSVLLQYDDNDVGTSIPTVTVTTAPTIVPTSLTPPLAPTSAPTTTTTTSTPQNETETLVPTSTNETETAVTPAQFGNRQLLLDSRVIVETSFTVVTAGSGTGFLSDFREHWDSSPTSIKVLYVFAFLFCFMILFGLGLGLLLWAGFCGNTTELRERLNPLLSREQNNAAPGKETNRDDHTMDESVGAFSPAFARNKEPDHYADELETIPKQIGFKRPFASSGGPDMEAPGTDDVAAPGRKPRRPRNSAANKTSRERNSAYKARMARNNYRQTANPNRDLAASFLNNFPRRKVASVRSKTPRSIHERNRPSVGSSNVVDDMPREKTASGIRWLRERDQLQQSTHSTNTTGSRRSVNQQKLQGSSHVSGLAPRRGGIALHGNPIPKSSQRPIPMPSQRPIPKSSQRPTYPKPLMEPIPDIPENFPSIDNDESSRRVHFDVESPPNVSCNDIPHGKDNPRPID